ncbi:MAG: RsmD family RNA methyltransferase [Planctomycetia bacterium]|nr:RsmD family RNA methyltransferase [Planctomycetia bacterium]
MRVQLRIVAGSLRGRKLTCEIHEGVRPTPQKVREALFSILGHAVPHRPFFDVFAGTGAIGLEALSRGASETVFVERDPELADAIDGYLRSFRVSDRGRVLRADVYRWIDRWRPPKEAVNVFLSPPFEDYQGRVESMSALVAKLEEKLADDSVLVVQGEESPGFDQLLERHDWDLRKYGRNYLAIWVKGEDPAAREVRDEEE